MSYTYGCPYDLGWMGETESEWLNAKSKSNLRFQNLKDENEEPRA